MLPGPAGNYSGKIFYSGMDTQSWLYDPLLGTPIWQPFPASVTHARRDYGNSLLLPATATAGARVLIAGGQNTSANNYSKSLACSDRIGDLLQLCNILASSEMINFGQTTPQWVSAGSMTTARVDANSVLMPDGKILVVGGENTCCSAQPAGVLDGEPTCLPVYTAELFDSATNSWLATGIPAPSATSAQRPRQYHSTAVLLPDASVLLAGGDTDACQIPANCTSQYPNTCPSGQIYKPGYFFRGARPTITSAPSSITYGQTYTINTPNGAQVTKVLAVDPARSGHPCVR